MAGSSGDVRQHAVADCAEFLVPVQIWPSGLETAGDRLSGPDVAGRCAIGDWDVYLYAHKKSNHRGSGDVWRLFAAVGAGVGKRIRERDLGAGIVVHVGDHALRIVRQGSPGHEGHNLLRDGDVFGIVFYSALDGIAALEVISELRAA